MKIINMLVIGILSGLIASPIMAQNIEMKSDYSDNVISKATQKIEYTLKVLKGDSLFYDGKFNVENSIISPVFFLKESKIKNDITEKAQISLPKETKDFEGKKENQNELEEQTQLRIAVHISKNHEDVWSQFFMQNITLSKEEELAVAQDTGSNKIAKANNNPILQKEEKELIVAHHLGKEATINWKDYKFIFFAEEKNKEQK